MVDRIGILQCIKKIDDSALRYLLLRLNQIQKSFEIEFVPFNPEDLFLQILSSRHPIDREKMRRESADFYGRQLSILRRCNLAMGLVEEPPPHFLVLAAAKFSNNYYSMRDSGISIIALGNWKRYMSPPSILEFILTLVAREVVAFRSTGLRGSVHLGTKGCLCDFNYSLDEVRYKVLAGFLCGFCRSTLESEGLAGLADDIEAILSKEWLGTPGQPASPASIVAGLGHDLFFVRGWRATPLESLKRSVQEEGAKQLVTLIQTIVAAIAVAVLIVFLGLKV